MVQPTPVPRPSEPSGVVPAEWPAQAADAIVEAIGKVRDRTTKPAITASRALVYGVFAAIVGIVAFVVLIALLVRLWSNYVGQDTLYILYGGLGLIFAFGGSYLLRQAKKPPAADHD